MSAYKRKRINWLNENYREKLDQILAITKELKDKNLLDEDIQTPLKTKLSNKLTNLVDEIAEEYRDKYLTTHEIALKYIWDTIRLIRRQKI